MLTIDIDDLKAAVSPQAHSGGQGEPMLIISWISSANLNSVFGGKSCWIVSDWGGYITATRSASILGELVRLEALGGAGTVRELATGEPKALAAQVAPTPTPEAYPTLEDLLG